MARKKGWLKERIRRRLWQARAALLWESLWPGLWPLLALAGLFLGLALLDVLPGLAGWFHAGILAAFAVGGLALLGLLLRGLRLPDRAAARRRLERDSGLSHRPLEVLEDHRAGSADPLGEALWAMHRRRMAARLPNLKPPRPRPQIAALDPLALRAPVLLLLVVALVVGHRDALARIDRALSPHLQDGPAQSLLLQVWVTPPAYTGVAPILLQFPGDRPAETPRVPSGSSVLAVLNGGAEPARLVADGRPQPFAVLDAGSQRAETTLQDGPRLAVEQGNRVIAAWTIEVVPDTSPGIDFTEQPQSDERGRVRFAAEASDDYGIARAWVTIRRPDAPEEDPLSVELPVPFSRPGALALSSWHDLASHPWAGLTVTAEPNAEDESGQTGGGRIITLVLPERGFTHPVAKAIVQQRRLLAADPSQRDVVSDGLDSLASHPGAFADDTVVFLALRVARWRLAYDESATAVPSLLDMLWSTALRVEEGQLPAAEQHLADALRDLDTALSENAPQAEIDQLMAQLQAAMQQYLQAMARQAAGSSRQSLPQGLQQRSIRASELSEMIERMREMSQTGSRDAARRMLSRMQEMMENLQAGRQGSPEDNQVSQALDQLQGLAGKQRQLMDKSFDQARTENFKPAEMGAQARTQEDLRRQLGEVMRQLGEGLDDIPESLSNAEQAMREATEALMGNQPGSAAEAQAEALDGLQRGTRSALDQLARRQGGQGGIAAGSGGFGRDPLGRLLPNGGGRMDTGDVRIPEQGEVHRAREILEELRRRASQANRPQVEKDYLERLLRQF